MPRTYIDINRERVDELRRQGCSWVQIKDDLGVSDSKLKTWRSEVEYVEPNRVPEDDELDAIVSSYSTAHPETGEVLSAGYILSEGLRVTRTELRACINRVDYEGRQRRLNVSRPIQRRDYDVTMPNDLWHADQNEKLPGRMFFIFGIVDGASRKIISMKVADNKNRWTVYNAFMQAIDTHGVPYRYRVDMGSENGYVNKVFNYLRPTETDEENNIIKGLIEGRSVNNIKIENQWLWTRRNVINPYRELYDNMKLHWGLVPRDNELSDRQKYILKHLIMSRIQQDLDQYVNVWNHHKVQTFTPPMTPNQVCMMRDKAQNLTDPEIINAITNFFDNEDLVPDVYQDEQHVDGNILRPTQHGHIFLTTDERDYFESEVPPLQLNDNLNDHFQNAWFHANTIMNQIIDER